MFKKGSNFEPKTAKGTSQATACTHFWTLWMKSTYASDKKSWRHFYEGKKKKKINILTLQRPHSLLGSRRLLSLCKIKLHEIAQNKKKIIYAYWKPVKLLSTSLYSALKEIQNYLISLLLYHSVVITNFETNMWWWANLSWLPDSHPDTLTPPPQEGREVE